MRWSVPLGRVRGTKLQIHATLLLLVAWLALGPIVTGGSILNGLAIAGIYLGIVLLHAAARSIAAFRLGLRARTVTFLPFGAVAQVDRPLSSHEALVVTAAGEAVAFVLSLVFMVIVIKGSLAIAMPALSIAVAIGLGHLIPAAPLDASRVLRAELAQARGPIKAATTVATLGQALALVVAFLALVGGGALAVVALGLWAAVADEAPSKGAASTYDQLQVSEVMSTDVRRLTPDEALENAIDHARAGYDGDFPVTDGRIVVGLLTRNDLLVAIVNLGRQAAVSDAMLKKFQHVGADEPLGAALGKLSGSGATSLPVVRDGVLVGLLSFASLGEMLAPRRSEKGRAPRAATVVARHPGT